MQPAIYCSRITIGKISYTKFIWNVDSGIKFAIRDNENLLDFKPVSQSQLASITNLSGRQIQLAEKLNYETISQLKAYTEQSKIRWQSIKYQTSGWEQLISWGLIGLNMGITVLFGICLLRLSCKDNEDVTIMNSDQKDGH